MSGLGWLRRLFGSRSRSGAHIERDVDAEFRFHLEMRAEALERGGLSGEEARARALREFGDADEAREYCASVDRETQWRRRRANWVTEARHDARHALRMLCKSPAFAVATVATLAVAMGTSTAVYGVLHAYLVRPLPFPQSDRLMSVIPGPSRTFRGGPSLAEVDWSRVDSIFEASAAWDLDGFTVEGERYASEIPGAWVSDGFFRALGLYPALGRGFRADEYASRAPVAIISHDLWVRRFGASPAAIGSTMTVQSADRPLEPTVITVVGVTPESVWPIHRFTDLLRPLPESSMPWMVKLTPGMSAAVAQQRLDAAVRAQLTVDIDPAWHMTLVPAQAMHAARARPVLVAVFGAALFMLLAACGSVAGALVSRMASRRSELALRMALGGTRGRIVRQILAESAVLSTLAGVLGFALAYVLLDAGGVLIERQLGTAAPGGVGRLRPDLIIMGIAVAGSAIVGVAVGLVPALLLSRDGMRSNAGRLGGLRGHATRPVGAAVRRILIAGQVAVAMVLLFGAGLMFRTLTRIAATDLGFRTEGIMKASMLLPQSWHADSSARLRGVERVLDAVERTPGVHSAAAVFPYPFRSAWTYPVTLEGTETDSPLSAALYTVSAGYLEILDIRVVRGRAITAADDERAALVAVVSERLAARLAPDGLLGRRIRIGDERAPWRMVVGVVQDTRKGYAEESVPDIYVPHTQNASSYHGIVVRTDGDETALFEPVRRAIATVEPALALAEVGSLRGFVESASLQRRGMTVLLGMFSIFALGLSALGLYASLSFTVVQRRAELAVRIAMGADARAILRLVVGEGVLTACAGALTGTLASLWLGRVLENQLYGVTARDPLTLAAVPIVLGAAALAACVVPGLRAARTDPAVTLRT